MSSFQRAIEHVQISSIEQDMGYKPSRVNVRLECACFEPRALIGHHVDDLRVHILWVAGEHL